MIDNNNMELGDQAAAKPAADPVGTLSQSEPTAHEPEAMTAEEWEAGGYYSVTITADPGDASKAKQAKAHGYDEYIALREGAKERGLYIVSESFETKEQYFPGLLTYSAAVDKFENANDKYIEFKSFPEFSKRAKIGVHDSVALAADTGGGKSSLAINFIDDLNGEYPIVYFNLEMKEITVLQRLVSIHSGLSLDRIEGYKKDEQTAKDVNKALKEITGRKALQVISDACSLDDVELIIKHSIQHRPDDEPTVVVIDHSLLIKTGEADRYKRFTAISERLHEMANSYNIVIFSLLQQNREGKKDENEPPKNSSLKESGSWENDSSHIVFLWYDPTANQKKLIITKNRAGRLGSFPLNYEATTQKYSEVKTQTATRSGYGGNTADTSTRSGKKTPREKRKDKLQAAVDLAYMKASISKTEVTLHDIAVEAGVAVSTVKNWIKEFGGYDINGEHYEPAGISDIVEGEGFTKQTPIEEQETPEQIRN